MHSVNAVSHSHTHSRMQMHALSHTHARFDQSPHFAASKLQPEKRHMERAASASKREREMERETERGGVVVGAIARREGKRQSVLDCTVAAVWHLGRG